MNEKSGETGPTLWAKTWALEEGRNIFHKEVRSRKEARWGKMRADRLAWKPETTHIS